MNYKIQGINSQGTFFMSLYINSLPGSTVLLRYFLILCPVLKISYIVASPKNMHSKTISNWFPLNRIKIMMIQSSSHGWEKGKLKQHWFLSLYACVRNYIHCSCVKMNTVNMKVSLIKTILHICIIHSNSFI